MKVDIISKESIKPLSPTPDHLRTFKLSILDQLAPPFHVPTFFFYSSPSDSTSVILHRLKNSLSENLTHFYPVAGRIDGNASFIDCNDKGVDFIEVRVDVEISEVLGQPETDVLKQLLPYDPFSIKPDKEAALMTLQVCIFGCGGMAVTVCVSHKICDAMAIASFFKGWSATATGHPATEIISPYLGMASLFPPKDFPMLMPPGMAPENKLVTKRFVFDATKLSVLKAKVANESHMVMGEAKDIPSRVEALTALIWKSAMAITRDTSGKVKPSRVSHMVSLRDKINPPLPENYLGNLWWFAVTPPTQEQRLEEVGLHGLADQVRNAIKNNIDGDYVKRFQDKDGLVKIFETLGELRALASKGEMEFYKFTSAVRVPFYGADFGWGKPIWVATLTAPLKNLITLMSSRNGDGIEAWVTMDDQDMAKFECHPDILEFASSSTTSAA